MDFCFMLLYKCFFFVRLHFKKKKKKIIKIYMDVKNLKTTSKTYKTEA